MEKAAILSADIQRALNKDGAIRVIDGRWSGGFVDENELVSAVLDGLLKIQRRAGVKFAVLSTDL